MRWDGKKSCECEKRFSRLPSRPRLRKTVAGFVGAAHAAHLEWCRSAAESRSLSALPLSRRRDGDDAIMRGEDLWGIAVTALSHPVVGVAASGDGT